MLRLTQLLSSRARDTAVFWPRFSASLAHSCGLVGTSSETTEKRGDLHLVSGVIPPSVWPPSLRSLAGLLPAQPNYLTRTIATPPARCSGRSSKLNISRGPLRRTMRKQPPGCEQPGTIAFASGSPSIFGIAPMDGAELGTIDAIASPAVTRPPAPHSPSHTTATRFLAHSGG